MKFFSAQFSYFAETTARRRNLRLLVRFIGILTLLIVVYSVLFHMIMEFEGQDHSWVTGFYWTLTVMSTLGFGDITFQSDLGRVFSIVVPVSGAVVGMEAALREPHSDSRASYSPRAKEAENEAVREKTQIGSCVRRGGVSLRPPWGGRWVLWM